MKHIFLNLKRFDVPVELGGVNRLAPVAEWGRAIVAGATASTTHRAVMLLLSPVAGVVG